MKVLNVGCGPEGMSPLPAHFSSWEQLRVDIDASVKPDIVADITDLSPIPDASVDSVWAAHCVEHLYAHQVPFAVAEFKRVLRKDGFVCVIVPDLQTIGSYLVADRLHEILYESDAGPITPHDMIFGYGVALAQGNITMAHRCGFTPTLLQKSFTAHSYGEILIRRRARRLELAVVARLIPAASDDERSRLVAALEL